MKLHNLAAIVLLLNLCTPESLFAQASQLEERAMVHVLKKTLQKKLDEVDDGEIYNDDRDGSYTSHLFKEDLKKAQKQSTSNKCTQLCWQPQPFRAPCYKGAMENQWRSDSDK